MNAKDLLGKKIIDKKARDLAKLAEINVNTKTFEISKIYGSVGNPISKKYYDIHVGSILAVGDYIQVAEVIEELEDTILDKIPEAEENVVKVNELIGKTVLDSEGNVAGKVSNVKLDIDNYKIKDILFSNSSTTFGKLKNEQSVNKSDITSIGDYIIINKVFKEENIEEEKDEDSVNINID